MSFSNRETSNIKGVDVHHIMKKQLCKKLGLKHAVTLNRFYVQHYFHINRLHNNFSENGKMGQRMLYGEILKCLKKMIKKYDLIIMPEEMKNIITVYKYCTVEMWAKEYLIEYMDEIIEGYAVIEKISAEIDAKEKNL